MSCTWWLLPAKSMWSTLLYAVPALWRRNAELWPPKLWPTKLLPTTDGMLQTDQI